MPAPDGPTTQAPEQQVSPLLTEHSVVSASNSVSEQVPRMVGPVPQALIIKTPSEMLSFTHDVETGEDLGVEVWPRAAARRGLAVAVDPDVVGVRVGADVVAGLDDDARGIGGGRVELGGAGQVEAV